MIGPSCTEGSISARAPSTKEFLHWTKVMAATPIDELSGSEKNEPFLRLLSHDLPRCGRER